MKTEELDKDVAFAIRHAMEKRQEAKGLEEQAKELKKEADEVLLPLLTTLDDLKAVDGELGTVSVVNQTRSSLDQDLAKDILLGNGVPAEVVMMAWDNATTTTPSTYVKYTQPKVKG